MPFSKMQSSASEITFTIRKKWKDSMNHSKDLPAVLNGKNEITGRTF